MKQNIKARCALSYLGQRCAAFSGPGQGRTIDAQHSEVPDPLVRCPRAADDPQEPDRWATDEAAELLLGCGPQIFSAKIASQVARALAAVVPWLSRPDRTRF